MDTYSYISLDSLFQKVPLSIEDLNILRDSIQFDDEGSLVPYCSFSILACNHSRLNIGTGSSSCVETWYTFTSTCYSFRESSLGGGKKFGSVIGADGIQDVNNPVTA